ncbi:MAG: metal-dependent hydrolase [Bradymonadaceae bacterium]
MDLKGIDITWLGHSTFLIRTPEGKTILVDPWLEGNPSCPEEFNEIEVDAILMTHGHNDHIGDVFTAAERCSGPIVGIYDLTAWLATRGIADTKLLGMNKGGTVVIDELDIAVSMTHAQHSSCFQDDDGTLHYLGEAAGFCIEFSNELVLYIAGDTCLFGDMEWIGELYHPDFAILPIGDHFTMDPQQAALAADLTGVEAVIPCHYDTFPLLTGKPAELRKFLETYEVEAEVIELEVGKPHLGSWNPLKSLETV